MARRFGIAQQAGITTGTSKKTLIQLIAADNHAVAVIEFGVSFDGTSNTDTPILVQLIRQTDAGTMSSLTPVKADDSNGDTLDTSAQHTATAEPTSGDILESYRVHPQTGIVKAFNRDTELIVGAGDRLGLVVTAAVSVTAEAFIKFEE